MKYPGFRRMGRPPKLRTCPGCGKQISARAMTWRCPGHTKPAAGHPAADDVLARLRQIVGKAQS